MKRLTLIALALTVAQTFASTNHGGVEFDSSVENDQINYLKTDLNYLYQSPVTEQDADFLKVTQMRHASGPILHNWLINRVRYIVGENFDFEPNLTIVSNVREERKVYTVMTNSGASLYMAGKNMKINLGVMLNGKEVPLSSPRVGLIQIGEGLFSKSIQINSNPTSVANSISRLGTLFHEARHSDGNGSNVAFTHDLCPPYHPYALNYACERVGNGAYSVGASALKLFLKNCTNCSTADKGILELIIMDNFQRVIRPGFNFTVIGLRGSIRSYTRMIDTYTARLENAKTDTEKEMIKHQIENFKGQIERLEREIRLAEAKEQLIPMGDPRPEGTYKNISIMASRKLMEDSLKK